MSSLPTILELAAQLEAGQTSSQKLVEQALARIEDPSGEGERAFLSVNGAEAMRTAGLADWMRSQGRVASPLLGLPVSIKDLFDIAGQVTSGGSKALKDASPAKEDAPVIARLRAAGAVLMGRTNMTEFAYSGLGVNPHHGTPGNPHDRARIPGGSSSGAAVSVGDQMAVVGLGSDTGGSVRIPAGYCGIAGYKPTQNRVPLTGCLPLSSSLDSIGALAPSISCCAIVDSVLAGQPIRLPEPVDIAGLRFGVVQNYVLEDIDPEVADAFEAALSKLSTAGAQLTDITLPELDAIPDLNAAGGFAAAESYAWHRDLLARKGNEYDPRVGSRIEKGADISAAEYIELVERRAELCQGTHRRTRVFDAVIMPTVANIAPRLDDLADDADYARLNLLCLRNTMVGNILDRCAATVPCQAAGDMPVGFMLMGETDADDWLIDVTQAVESVLSR